MAYDFSKLTDCQQRVLTFQGWVIGSPFPQPDKRTVKKLIDRGLVIAHPRTSHNFTVIEYEVPYPVHYAWCKWCSEQRF